MKKTISYILLCILLFSGCGSQKDPDEWNPVNDFVRERVIEFTEDEKNKKIHIYRLDPRNFNITFGNEEPKYISDWANELDAEIVINGAYFNEDFSPSGYLKINNERIGELIFDQNLSGLIQVNNGEFTIRDLALNPLQTDEAVDYGLQSFPYLIKDGQAAIKEDSGKRARRTALGIDSNGMVYIIFADLVHISLFQLMKLLEDSEIPFVHVLNFDGGPSSGISIYGELKDSVSKVPSVILFKENL
jgi:exopolysaccharide biosynthesis protein